MAGTTKSSRAPLGGEDGVGRGDRGGAEHQGVAQGPHRGPCQEFFSKDADKQLEVTITCDRYITKKTLNFPQIFPCPEEIVCVIVYPLQVARFHFFLSEHY